jgi:hypothetical protein
MAAVWEPGRVLSLEEVIAEGFAEATAMAPDGTEHPPLPERGSYSVWPSEGKTDEPNSR